MTPSDRLRSARPSDVLARTLAAVLGLALVWYGVMIILLASKVSPATVEDLSAYRTIYDFFAGLQPSDITGTVRLISGLVGLVVFVTFGWLLWREATTPMDGRGRLSLDGDTRGNVGAHPRAIERAVEVAALADRVIREARARYDGEAVNLDVETRYAVDLPQTLRRTRQRAAETLRIHGFPVMPVNVTLAGHQRTNRRELA